MGHHAAVFQDASGQPTQRSHFSSREGPEWLQRRAVEIYVGDCMLLY